MSILPVTDGALVAEPHQLIDGDCQHAAVAVNAELTLIYWPIDRDGISRSAIN